MKYPGAALALDGPDHIDPVFCPNRARTLFSIFLHYVFYSWAFHKTVFSLKKRLRVDYQVPSINSGFQTHRLRFSGDYFTAMYNTLNGR